MPRPPRTPATPSPRARTRSPARTSETQLYTYDPTAFDGDGAVAISAGDLATADNVAVTVPGFGTDGESAPYQADRARTLYESTRFLDPNQTNATMFWIGYDAPDNPPWEGDGDWAGVLTESHATAGGERLADTARRPARVPRRRAGPHDCDRPQLRLHDHRARRARPRHPGRRRGLRGEPRRGRRHQQRRRHRVDPDHVWAGANSRDPIANLGNHGAVHLELLGGGGLGDDPAEDDFGANRFQAESTTRADDAFGIDAFADHSKYFEHDTEALFNMSQIVNGNYDAVVEAGQIHDPWYDSPQDPEFDRDPTSPATRLDP